MDRLLVLSVESPARSRDSPPGDCVACIAVCGGQNQRFQIFSIQSHTLLAVGSSVFAAAVWTVQVFLCSVMVGLDDSELQVSSLCHESF